MAELPEWTSFERWVHQALVHLYDPNELKKSPLNVLFQVRPAESGSTLRQTLVDTIEELKPLDNFSQQSQAWRTYRTITHRFVEQFSQNEVAVNMGISIRQMRRQEKLALQVLCDHLVKKYQVQAGDLMCVIAAGGAPAEPHQPASSKEHELQWLEREAPAEPVHLPEFFQSILATIQPLVDRFGVTVAYEVPAEMPAFSIHVVSFKQTLMTLLSVAVPASPGETVRISVTRLAREVRIRVQAGAKPEADWSSGQDLDPENLEMLRSLVQLSNGTIEVTQHSAEGRFEANLTFPVEMLLPVLIVDDNKDTLQLYQRYLLGTHYEFIGMNDPAAAIPAAERLEPAVIVLDVMMPGIDGWEMLGRLRTHPKTHAIPIIVCSILPQEQVAITLGAAAFLRKPVNRKTLLAILDKLSH